MTATKNQTFIDQPDYFLRTLVKIVNGSTATNIGVTLQVSGFLVSGTLVNIEEYFKTFGEHFASGIPDPNIADDLRKSFASFAPPPPESEEDDIPPVYIHLKDAKFYNTVGNPIPGNMGVLWRGRISEVGGFVLGTLNAEAG